MTASAIEEAFDLYATTKDHRQRQRMFSELVMLKALPKHAADHRFIQGLEAWEHLLAREDATDDERLLAIAELMRTVQVVKAKLVVNRISTVVSKALECPLPPSHLLKEADERLNLARSCSHSQANWLPAYMAQAIADEDAGEKARAEFMANLLSRSTSVSATFTLLGAAFANIRFETESPGDSMGKRLIRTLAVLRPLLVASPLEAGSDVGKQLDEWLRSAMRAQGKPKEEKTQVDLTREVALTLHDLVRTRFSVATEPNTFAALRQCRNFFTSVSWPVELRETMELLIQDVSEALLLLGRQDVPQQAVLEQLELVCGLKERAKAVATQLADSHAELPERIREWLRRGRLVATQQTSDVLQASLLDANDTALGLALIESRKLMAADETIERIIGTIEIYEPSLVRSARSYAQQVHDTVTAVQDVASRRGIALVGQEGEEIEFVPKYFDLLRPVTDLKVVIRRPAVVRAVGTEGITEVLMKGLVE